MKRVFLIAFHTYFQMRIYNFGQNIVDKSTKSGNIGSSMKRFTTDVLQF